MFVVLQWADLGDLQSLIRAYKRSSRVLTPLAALGLTLHIAQALEHLHTHRVIHRDVKGLNVILCTPDATAVGVESSGHAVAVPIVWPSTSHSSGLDQHQANGKWARAGRPPKASLLPRQRQLQAAASGTMMHSSDRTDPDRDPDPDLSTAPVQVIARLADLGVSRPLGEETAMARTFFGTPLFVSPELCLGRPYDSSTDIWSLGVLLHEMLTGSPPF